jgi:hypothetical protein
MIEGAQTVNSALDVIAIVLSANIIFWFSWAIYYNIKRILLYKQTTGKVFFTTYFNLIVSFLFVVAFSYIIVATAIKGHIIDNSSFGAVVIRPLIVLEAVGTAISEKEKYRRKGSKYL